MSVKHSGVGIGVGVKAKLRKRRSASKQQVIGEGKGLSVVLLQRSCFRASASSWQLAEAARYVGSSGIRESLMKLSFEAHTMILSKHHMAYSCMSYER